VADEISQGDRDVRIVPAVSPRGDAGDDQREALVSVRAEFRAEVQGPVRVAVVVSMAMVREQV
jgi:hypothetical protein